MHEQPDILRNATARRSAKVGEAAVMTESGVAKTA